LPIAELGYEMQNVGGSEVVRSKEIASLKFYYKKQTKYNANVENIPTKTESKIPVQALMFTLSRQVLEFLLFFGRKLSFVFFLFL